MIVLIDKREQRPLFFTVAPTEPATLAPTRLRTSVPPNCLRFIVSRLLVLTKISQFVRLAVSRPGDLQCT